MVSKKLRQMGLPGNLVDLIKDGRLLIAIREELARLDRLNKLLDEWEAANPVQYKLLPWYESRQKWKAEGRPAPDWWELLLEAERRKAPISTHQITNQILGTASTDHWERVKADPERYEKVKRMRRVYGPRKRT